MAALMKFLQSEGYEKFKKALFLTRETSKMDPENEPFKSLYEARTILSDLKSKIIDIRNEDPSNRELLCCLACLEMHLGANFVESDETSSGEEHLTDALKILEEFKMEDCAVSIYLHTLNHLSILWSARNQHEKAKEFLERAEILYQNYKQNVSSAPKHAEEPFQEVENDAEGFLLREKKFESLYTHTLYYKAQVLAKLGDSESSARFCHITLHRQLDANEYDPVEWALNAATLSQVYISQEKFPVARHCLASASVVFREAKTNREKLEEDKENLDYKDADIMRCWIKYGLQLLESSREDMMRQVDTFDDDHKSKESLSQKVEELDHNADKSTTDHLDYLKKKGLSKSDDIETSDYEKEEKTYEPFNLEVTLYEEKVTDQLVRTFDDARQVFLFVQEAISHAKAVYSLDGNCSDYIQLVQDHSKAFKLLAFFELDIGRQCRMHKRRVDMLLATLNEINPQYYLLVCRQLIYELAETYSAMMDLKLSTIELQGMQPTPHTIKKINSLAQQSIKQYQAYLDTLKGGKPDYPDTFPDGNTRPALLAFFCIGRLWGKITTPDVSERLSCMNKSLENYKFVVNYCSRHPEARAEIAKEHALCEELSALLPLKMGKIRDGEFV